MTKQAYFLSALFTLSGATSVSYEIIWFKRLAVVFGSSNFALTAVLTAFLGGLALGAFLCGRFLDQATNPLKYYALFEIAIGIWASLIGPITLAFLHIKYSSPFLIPWLSCFAI